MKNTKAFIWAHRGSRLSHRENTIAAFLQARQDGADGIELDVRMTADKQLVLVHDSTLNRTCGVNLRVKDATLEELQAADPEIPSLEQVFRTLSSGIHCNVELKSSPDRLTSPNRFANGQMLLPAYQ